MFAYSHHHHHRSSPGASSTLIILLLLLALSVSSSFIFANAASLTYNCIEDGTLAVDPETNQLAYTLEINNIHFTNPNDHMNISYAPVVVPPAPPTVDYQTTPCHVKVTKITNVRDIAFQNIGSLRSPPGSSFLFEDITCSGETLRKCIELNNNAVAVPPKNFIFRNILLESKYSENLTAFEESVTEGRTLALIRARFKYPGLERLEVTNCHIRVNFSAFHLAFHENNNTFNGSMLTNTYQFFNIVFLSDRLVNVDTVVFRNSAFTAYGGIFPQQLNAYLAFLWSNIINVSSLTFDGVSMNYLPTAPLRLRSLSSSSSSPTKSFKMSMLRFSRIHLIDVGRFESIKNATFVNVDILTHFEKALKPANIRVLSSSFFVDNRRFFLSNINVIASFEESDYASGFVLRAAHQVHVMRFSGGGSSNGENSEFLLTNANVVCEHKNATGNAVGALVGLIYITFYGLGDSLPRKFTVSSSTLDSNYVAVSDQDSNIFAIDIDNSDIFDQTTDFHFSNISARLLQNVASNNNNNDDDDDENPVHSRDVVEVPRSTTYALYMFYVRRFALLNAKSIVIDNCKASIGRTPELVAALAERPTYVFDGTAYTSIAEFQSSVYVEEKLVLDNNRITLNLLDEAIRHHLITTGGFPQHEVDQFLDEQEEDHHQIHQDSRLGVSVKKFLLSLPSSSVTTLYRVTAIVLSFSDAGRLTGITESTQLAATNAKISARNYNHQFLAEEEHSSHLSSLRLTRDLFVRGIFCLDIINISSILISNVSIDMGLTRGDNVYKKMTGTYALYSYFAVLVLSGKLENGVPTDRRRRETTAAVTNDACFETSRRSFIVENVKVSAHLTFFESTGVDGVYINTQVSKAYAFDCVIFRNFSVSGSADMMDNSKATNTNLLASASFRCVYSGTDLINIGKLEISNTFVSVITSYQTVNSSRSTWFVFQASCVVLNHLENITDGIQITNAALQFFVGPNAGSEEGASALASSFASRRSTTSVGAIFFASQGKRANIGTIQIENVSVIIDISSLPVSSSSTSTSSPSVMLRFAVVPTQSWFSAVQWTRPSSFYVHPHLTDYEIAGSVIVRNVSLYFTTAASSMNSESSSSSSSSSSSTRMILSDLKAIACVALGEQYNGGIQGNIIITEVSLRAQNLYYWPSATLVSLSSSLSYTGIRGVEFNFAASEVKGDLNITNLILDVSFERGLLLLSPGMEVFGFFTSSLSDVDRVSGSVHLKNIASSFKSLLSPSKLVHAAVSGVNNMYFIGSVGESFVVDNISTTTFLNNTIRDENVSSLPVLLLHGVGSENFPFVLPQREVRSQQDLLSKNTQAVRISNVRCNIVAAINIEQITATCVYIGSSSTPVSSSSSSSSTTAINVVVENVSAKYSNIIVKDSPAPPTALSSWSNSLSKQADLRAFAVSSCDAHSSSNNNAVHISASTINLELVDCQFLRKRTFDSSLTPVLLFVAISPVAMFNVQASSSSSSTESISSHSSGVTLSLSPSLYTSAGTSTSTITCVLNNVAINSTAPISISHFAIDFGRSSRVTPSFTLNYREGASSIKIISGSEIHTTAALRVATIIDEKVMLIDGNPLIPSSFFQSFGRTQSTINFVGSSSNTFNNGAAPSSLPFDVSVDSTLSSSSSLLVYTVIVSRYRNSLRVLTVDGVSPLLLSSSIISSSNTNNNTNWKIQTGLLYIERGPSNDYSEAETELAVNFSDSSIFTVKNVNYHLPQQPSSASSSSTTTFSLVKFGLDPMLNTSFTEQSEGVENSSERLDIVDNTIRSSTAALTSSLCHDKPSFVSIDSNIHLPSSWNVTFTRNAIPSSMSLMSVNGNNNGVGGTVENVFGNDAHITLHGNRFHQHHPHQSCPVTLVSSSSSSSSSTSSNSSSGDDIIGGTFIFECNLFSKPDKEIMVKTLLHQLHAHSVVDLCPRSTNTSSASFSLSESKSSSLSHNETESHLTPTASPSSSSSNSVNSTLSKSYISISKSGLTETNSEQVIVVIGLDAEILAATIATAQSVTAVASVLGSAPMAAMSMAKSLSVLQLLGCPRFDPQGRRWSEVDPGFSWTLLPTISFAGGYYHAAIIGFVGLCLLGAFVGLCSKSMPPPPKDPIKKKEPTDKVEEQLYSARGGRFLNFLAMATFPFLGQFFSAAGVVIGNASSSLRTDDDGGALDYILGVLPFIFSLPLIFIGFRKLNDAITVRRKVGYKQPIIEINSRTKEEDFRLEPITKRNVVPYYSVRSFIARSLDSIHKSNNDEFSKVRKVKWIQGLLKSSFGRFFLIGHYTWIQDESYFKSVFQKCKNEEERQKVRRSHLLLTIPRLFVRLKGPVKETNILGIEEVDAESWRPKLSTFYILICAVAAMVCCFLQGLSKGMDNEKSMCRTAIGVISFVSLFMFFLTLYLRPLMVPFFNVLFIILEFCGAAVGLAVFILTESYPDSFPESISDSVMAIQLLAIISATFVGFMLLVLKLIRISLMVSSGLQLVNEEEYWRRNKIENEIRFGGETGEDHNNVESFEMGLVSSNTGSREDGNNDQDPLLQFSPTAAANSSVISPSSTKKKKRKPVVVVLQKKKIVKVPPKRKIDIKDEYI